MKIDDMIGKIICGDCLGIMKDIPDNSIDCIVTDPPYQLISTKQGFHRGKQGTVFTRTGKGGFMGKEWDILPPVEVWVECLRVLKPGAFAFIMCTPRQDSLCQMLLNLAQAGFQTGFTSIYWTYACLSADTEVLTQDGWKNWGQLHKSNKYDRILVYDINTGEYKYESPTNWNSYPIQENMYRIKSKDTDQLVSRNHRVYTKQGFVFAENLKEQDEVVYLSEMPSIVCDIPSRNKKEKGSRNILFNKLQTKSSDIYSFDKQEKAYTQNVRREKTNSKRTNDGFKKSCLERWCNLFQNTWKLCRCKIYSLSEKIFEYGSERQLCYGTSNIGSTTNRQTSFKNRSSSPYRPQSNEQRNKKSNVVQNQPKTQTTRSTITKEYYKGIIYCPTVSTGCFVARRNGKIFLTGNSGFPKAQNVSLTIDKQECRKQLIEKLDRQPTKDEFEKEWKTFREVIGKNRSVQFVEKGVKERKEYGQSDGLLGKYGHGVDVTAPATNQAKSLDGSFGGFQPKPAVEIILVVMKPLSEKTYTEQALKNRKGVTWLGKGKIPYKGEDIDFDKKQDGRIYGDGNCIGKAEQKETTKLYKKEGRFPANLLVSDDVLDDGTNCVGRHFQKSDYHKGSEMFGGGYIDGSVNDISGSFSRYFSLDKWFKERFKQLSPEVQKVFPFLIVPKASKSEKNRGMQKYNQGIEIPNVDNTDKYDGKFPCSKADKDFTNKHPTCKPIKLMSYLITIGSEENDIILDPFAGSGTTGLACKMLNRKYIMIEKSKEYFGIMKARINSIGEGLL